MSWSLINNVKDFNSMDSESLEELVGVLAKKNKPFHRASRKKFDSHLEDVKLGLGKTNFKKRLQTDVSDAELNTSTSNLAQVYFF